jgi:uncharacterized cupin superfamily protein
MQLVEFKHQRTEPEVDHPRPERVISGNPKRTTWNHFTSSSGEMSAGVWSSEVGSWRIEIGPALDEFFFVVSGRVKVTGDDGHAAVVGPGESLVIPAGFKGVFEVVEAVTKHYVIVARNV